jgi:hypothetical protein
LNLHMVCLLWKNELVEPQASLRLPPSRS